MKKNKELERNRVKTTIFTAFIIIVMYVVFNNLEKTFKTLSHFLNIIKPFIYGVVLGYFFLFPVKKIQKLITRGKKTKYDKYIKVIIAVLVYVLFFWAMSFLISSVLPILYNSAIEILENAPKYLNNLEKTFIEKQYTGVLAKIDVHEIFKNIKTLDLSKIMLEQLKKVNIQHSINTIFNAAGALVKILIVFVISFNIVLYNERLSKEFKKLTYGILGKKKASILHRNLKKIDEVFVKFIYAQMIDGVIVAIIFSITFLILKVRYAVALGILVGVGNLIPYIGTFISICLVFLITIFTGGLPQGLFILVISIVLQQIDAQIINPKVIGDQLDLTPPIIILAILIGGAYFGPVIVFIAAPIIAVLKSLIYEYIEEKRLKEKKEKIKNIRKHISLNKNEEFKKSYKFNYMTNYKLQKNKKTIKKPKVETNIKGRNGY